MASTSLPLHCSICPKNPTFSDVSHLLTHIASKSHLSYHYKTKIRAANDPVSRNTIETYDTWYATWNVEQLMSERLYVKDRRKPKNDNSQSERQQPQKRCGVSASVLDPQLYSAGSRADAGSVRKNETDGLSLHAQDLVLNTTKAGKPRLYLWQTDLPASYRAAPLASSSPLLNSRTLFDPFESSSTSMAIPDREILAGLQSPNEPATKLKGVFWPGMAIFDAATPEMKRKRNQKKDVSVLEQLEHNSLQVEAIEFVYRPSGSLKKSRPISGQVDPDSSPIRVERPLPRKRSSIRTVLGSLDVNRDTAGRNATFAKRRRFSRPSTPIFHPILSFGSNESADHYKSFPVRQNHENQVSDNYNGMCCLTSEFQYPQQSRANHNLPIMYAPHTLLYDPACFAPATNSYADYRTLPYIGVYGNVGHELSGFLTNSAQISNEEKFAQMEKADDELTISAHSDD